MVGKKVRIVSELIKSKAEMITIISKKALKQ